MTIDLSDFKLTPLPSRETPPYASADPSTDLRLLLAGTDWSEPGHGGYPTRTEAGSGFVRPAGTPGPPGPAPSPG